MIIDFKGPQITELAELVMAEPKFRRLSQALYASGFRLARVRSYSKGTSFTVRLVWRMRDRGMSAVFTGKFQYTQADLRAAKQAGLPR